MGIGGRTFERSLELHEATPGVRPPAQALPGTDIRFIALAFLAGLVLLHALPQLPPLYSFPPLLALGLLRFPGRMLWLAAVVALAWGSLWGQQLLDDRLPAVQHGEIRWLSGWIEGIPQAQPGRLRFEFVSDASPRRVRVSWYGQTPELRPGDCWQLQLRLKTPRGSVNPGGFDYEAWLWRQRIAALGYVRQAKPCADNRWTLDRWRQQAASRLALLLEGYQVNGVIRALSLGEKDGISDEQWTVFRHTGTSHLVAISGLHIGLVFGVCLLLLRWIIATVPGLRRWPVLLTAAAGASLAALAYAAMAGFALPTQRALAGVVVVLLAMLLRRSVSASRLLALAMLAVLLMDPFALLAPGFWLSFGAVGWILYILGGRTGGAGRWRAWLILQPALVILLAPLTLFWFGQASVVAPLANAVLIPLFLILVPLVLLAVVLALALPALGAPLLQTLAWGMDYGWQLLQTLAHMPLSHLSLPQPAVWQLAVAIAGLFLLFAPRGVPARWLGVLALLPLGLPPTSPPAGAVRLSVLDVGQGLAALVQTRHHSLLFDAGPRYPGGFDAGEAIVKPFLIHSGIRQLDAFVLSHGDIDHRGGAEAIIQAFQPRLTLGEGLDQACWAGRHWRWDGVEFRVLHPGQPGQGNNASCVLRVSSGGGSLLLTGDIEREAEEQLYSQRQLRTDVLLVPHHGSATSSSDAFIDAVSPRLALVAAGYRNRWGFPRPQVQARYESRDIPLHVTGDSGAIVVQLQAGAPPRVQRWRRDHSRFWRARDIGP